ncbi:nucleoporin Nup37-like [Anneissia japonica]|uniref:nucleoporin Nup37-like n=1 Tax=Anneissia japonica TaxID=1529436 RepID=UPI0014255FB9|nr:nucleoporin Nup37-like [Anneissia japonica]
MEQENSTKQLSIDCKEPVTCVEFCPFETASHLIAIGGSMRILIGTCVFPEEDKDRDAFEFRQVNEFHHGCRVDAISWSPRTNLDCLPRCLRFCTAGSDFRLRLFTSDLKEDNTVQVLDGHSDYINEVGIETLEGDLIASVSDDCTCRTWDPFGQQKALFPLKSQGMSVNWHPHDPMKLMVAEKGGTIRFYDMRLEEPIMTLDAGPGMLLSANWCWDDTACVGAVVNGDWMIWDTSNSSQAIEIQRAHSEKGRYIRWCHSSSSLFATLGQPNNQLKIFHLDHHQVPIKFNLPVQGGISWHAFLPVCAAGGNRKVHLFTAEL